MSRTQSVALKYDIEYRGTETRVFVCVQVLCSFELRQFRDGGTVKEFYGLNSIPKREYSFKEEVIAQCRRRMKAKGARIFQIVDELGNVAYEEES